VHASASTTKERLESQVAEARASAEKTNGQVEQKAQGAREGASEHWTAARKDWNAHIAQMRRKADDQKATLDATRAEHRAQDREDDAVMAVDFAMQAVEEAEYEVLDAILARSEANSMAAASA
jgi:vacuolar-type H+-ATPase subunit I/STV1